MNINIIDNASPSQVRPNTAGGDDLAQKSKNIVPSEARVSYMLNEEGNASPSALQAEFAEGIRKLERPQSAVINIKSNKVKFAQEGHAKAQSRARKRDAEVNPQINFLSSLDDIRRAYNPTNDIGFQERILKFARATFSEIEH